MEANAVGLSEQTPIEGSVKSVEDIDSIYTHHSLPLFNHASLLVSTPATKKDAGGPSHLDQMSKH
jgi:hypothetical protein